MIANALDVQCHLVFNTGIKAKWQETQSCFASVESNIDDVGKWIYKILMEL